MRILHLFFVIILLSSCATVEVAKEVTKASKSISTSLNNLIKNSQNNSEDKSLINGNTGDDKKIITQEIVSLEKEKEEKAKLIKKQKKTIRINFLNKTTNEIKAIVGEPKLIRIDGNSKIIRFDNNFCRLFLFVSEKNENSKIKYFEIRNKKGLLIINSDEIETCYRNFKLI